MIWLIRRLRHDFATWDRPIRLAFTIGVILLIVVLIVALVAPSEARVPALVGAGALVIVLELTVLWGNRGMVSAYTHAQRLFIDGDLSEARNLLEAARARGKVDARTLTLLGNTYRQLGALAESEAVLSEAIDKAPNHYFPIYGFGRTLLSEGRYAEAADAIRRALALGAPPVVQVDLGEACYRLNRSDQAAAALQSVAASDVGAEAHRALMVSYLLSRLDQAPPPAPELIETGLPYWQAAAERFRATPYGAALALDVREMMRIWTHV